MADDRIIGFNVVGEVINAKHKEKQDIIAKITLFSVDSCTAKTFIQTMHTHHSSDDEWEQIMAITGPDCLPDPWLKHIHFEKEFYFKN